MWCPIVLSFKWLVIGYTNFSWPVCIAMTILTFDLRVSHGYVSVSGLPFPLAPLLHASRYYPFTHTHPHKYHILDLVFLVYSVYTVLTLELKLSSCRSSTFFIIIYVYVYIYTYIPLNRSWSKFHTHKSASTFVFFEPAPGTPEFHYCMHKVTCDWLSR